MSWSTNILAAISPLEHLVDRPWRINGCDVPWLSSQIAVMILAALLLAAWMPFLARRRAPGAARRSMGFIELLVLFVRGQIARPVMGPIADRAVPFLATLFMFVLMCNLLGLVPLAEFFSILGLDGWGGQVDGRHRFSTPIGGTPTSMPWVGGALAALTYLVLMLSGYVKQVYRLWKGQPHAGGHGSAGWAGGNIWLASSRYVQSRTWPLPVAAVLGVWTWLNGFVPAVPGVVGLFMWPLLLVIEFVGYLAKCFALCVRLVANETGGHILLSVLLVFAQSSRGWHVLAVGLPAGVGVVLMTVMELLVAVLQAYIFTFLSALFIGLAVSGEH